LCNARREAISMLLHAESTRDDMEGQKLLLVERPQILNQLLAPMYCTTIGRPLNWPSNLIGRPCAFPA
jgi:hypothetical protein